MKEAHKTITDTNHDETYLDQQDGKQINSNFDFHRKHKIIGLASRIIHGINKLAYNTTNTNTSTTATTTTTTIDTIHGIA